MASGSNVRIIVAAGAAMVIAFTIAVPSLRGISTWKYALAALGVVLFVWGSLDKK
ncbi:MAG TPA: hypothetical protein VF456_12120 [Vicinamibacterales bacterium]